MLKLLLSHKIFRIPYSKIINREHEASHDFCPMFVDLADIEGPSSHIIKSSVMTYEPEIVTALSQYLGDGRVMIDVGANIGPHTVLLGKKFPKSQFYSFEPHSYAFYLLEKNIRLHNLKNVKAFNFGLGKTKSKMTLYHHKRNSGGHSFVRGLKKSKFKPLASVIIEPLDDFTSENKIKHVDLIKIDVEGFEYEVLLGAQELISKQRPAVMFEYTPHLYQKMGYPPEAPLEFFLSQRYVLFDLERQCDFIIASELLLAMGNRLQTNILAKPW